MRKFNSIVVLLIFLVLAGCASSQQEPDVVYKEGVSSSDGGREWGALEVELIAQKMIESLYQFLREDYQRAAYLEVKKFRNRTSEHIDTSLLTDEISTELIKRRIKFIDSSLTKDSIEEIENGMTGLYDSATAIPTGKLKQPNLYLTGDIREAVTTKDGRELQYLVVTMKLYNIATREIMWQDHARLLKSKAMGKRVEF